MELRRAGRTRVVAPSWPPRDLAPWALTALVLGGGVATFVWRVAALPALPGDVTLPWWMLALAYALATVGVVHFRVQRQAHSITLSEVPLALGLVTASPASLLAGGLLGCGVALVVHRHQRGLKLAFNLALLLVEVDAASLVQRALLDGAPPASLRGWLATVAATAGAAALSWTLVNAVVATSGGRGDLHHRLVVLGFALPTALLNTALTLAGLRVMGHDAAAAVLIVIPVGALAVAYRGYLREGRKHERVRLLYDSSAALQRSRGETASVTTLLSRAQEMFNAETVELILLPSDQSPGGLRYALEGGQLRTASVAGEDDVESMTAMRLPAFLDSRGPLRARGIRDGMVVAVDDDRRRAGLLLVANRRDSVSTFDSGDLELLEAFAGPASVSITNARLEAQLEHRAFHDPLTGLANRALLMQRLHAVIDAGERGRIAVLFIDLDDFKEVNDSLGHLTGDRLLAAVAARLEACLGPTQLAARLGGDEFAILVDPAADAATATAVAGAVLDALRAPFSIGGYEVSIHASVGIVLDDPTLRTVDDLLSSADLAMYRAKLRGKDRSEVFEPIMQLEVLARHHLRHDLERAIEGGALETYYQPVVDIATQRIVGAEALVRWNHPTRGAVSPDEFIPLAEDTGLIIPLGHAVLRAACVQLVAWDTLLPTLRMSVNLSGKQLQQPGFVDGVAATLEELGVAPERLVLEVTERLMVEDGAALAGLGRLRDLGVRIAVDDFGTGYSSLSCLRDLPIDILKIAKPFVDMLGRTDDGVALVETIVRLAGSLHLSVVAEGVERPEQADHLERLGCRLVQGFLYSRAVPADAFAALVARQRPDGSVLTLAG